GRWALQSWHQSSVAAGSPRAGTSFSSSPTPPFAAAAYGAPARSYCAPPAACRDSTRAIVGYHSRHTAYHLYGARQENLELLSNALSLELEFEGMEIPVGPYKVDV